MSLGSGSLVQWCWLINYWFLKGSSLPSLSSPLLHLNSLFWWSSWDLLDNLSQDGQDCLMRNNFSFSSGTAQLHWQNGWYRWLADLLHQALQLPRGKQVPWCLWPGNIWSFHCGGHWEQGISSFCPSFQHPDCKEQVRVASSVFAIHFVGQHVPIFGVQALRNDLILSPPHAPVESFLGTPTWVSEPVVTSTFQTWPNSPQNLA